MCEKMGLVRFSPKDGLLSEIQNRGSSSVLFNLPGSKPMKAMPFWRRQLAGLFHPPDSCFMKPFPGPAKAT